MSGSITGTLTFTPEELWLGDSNYPGGSYSMYYTIYGHGYQTFDFTRNVYYPLIYAEPNIGILVVDLSTMTAVRSVTLAQMYADTPYGSPPGTPRTTPVWDIITGNGTDIFMMIGPTKDHPYFVRVDATTYKVTGEFAGTFHDPHNGLVNKTTNHTIVAYNVHAVYGLGLEIFDGTGMTLLGMSTSPIHSGYESQFIPGGTHPDGSCDFIMIDSDIEVSGTINLWRINVSDSLVITSTMTGTFDATTVYDPNAGSSAWIGQLNYDAANDCIIFWLQQDINGPATWFTSVNWDGSINWSTHVATAGTTYANRGQAQLTGNTLMAGPANHPFIIDTTTGDIIFTGTLTAPGLGGGYYYHVWDSERSSYWTYALASYGFSRIDFVSDAETIIDAELIFQPHNSFTDLSVESTRRLFIAASGTPQWVGQNGALPFGDQPAVYLTTTGPPLEFTQNNGDGGTFPLSGTIHGAAGPGCTPHFITEAAGPAGRPEWRLTVTDDGGRTWSRLVKPRAIGATGQYKTRLRWLKMGQFRQRSMKLECTDPVRRNIIGVYLDLTQGMS